MHQHLHRGSVLELHRVFVPILLYLTTNFSHLVDDLQKNNKELMKQVTQKPFLSCATGFLVATKVCCFPNTRFVLLT
jgi:hypothetical protein